MLIPKIGQGKAIVLLSGVIHKQPKLNDLTNLEPLITKEIRLQWLAKLNPKKYGGLSYLILEDCGNNVVKIETDMFGKGYISSKAKYYCTVDDKPKYEHGKY